MIFNGNDIKKLIQEENIIENCNQEYIGSASCDISMSSQILKMKKTFKPIDLSNPEKIEPLYETIDVKDGYKFKSNECIFAILNEKITLPQNMVAHIRPRTSLSRLGIIINLQHINAGYEGILNIAMYNLSPNTYILKEGMRIGQVVFEELTDGMTENLLYSNEKTPVYQNEDGKSGSKIYADFIGKVYRHFKGNYYFIESVSTDSETGEDIIVYRPLYERKDSMLWTRPAKMFFEEIDEKRNDNVTGQKHRFELVEDLTKDYANYKKEKGGKE